jgi:aspartate/methionine/tyrosine aminotransferase
MPRHPLVAPSLAGIKGSVYSSLGSRLENFRGEVYPLHIGDTWMEPAEGCRMEDLRVAENPGMHRYTSVHGLPALLDAIVERTRAKTGVPTEREHVLVTAGATGGLGAVAGAVLAPGDEVLILAPYWPLIEGIVRSFHGVPIAVPFLGVADSVETAVATVARHLSPRTVALYVATPNNPTGAVIPAPWLSALAAWAAKNSLWIWADEVYEDYLYDGEHTYTRPFAPARTFSCHSFSKAYGMAGNRCGYVVGPREVMAELRKVSTHTFYSTPTAAQLAAVRALAGAGDVWATMARERYRDVGRQTAARLGVPAPQGSTFLFLDVAVHLDERGLFGLLEDCVEQGLFVAPGPSFGPYPAHVRLCYTAAPPEVVLRGVEVLARRIGARMTPAAMGGSR